MVTEEAIFPESKVRIFFFPYITSGHFHPMLDIAALFSDTAVASSTIIVTPSNAHLASPRFPTHVLPLPPTSNLPDGWDSTSSPTSFSDFHTINASLSLLYTPLLNLLRSDRPHCLVSDSFLPWTADVAAELGIPRVVFDGMSSYSRSVVKSIKEHRPQDSVAGDGIGAFMTSEAIADAVERVMGGGKEATEMRRRAEKLGEEARGTMKEGGSSWMDVNRFIEDLMSLNQDLLYVK